MNGDAAALNELFIRCIPQLQRTAARFLNNRQDSEDALQDGLLLGLRHVSQFQGRSQFSTWMHTIVANAAKSTLRRQRFRSITSSLDDPQPDQQALTLSDIICDHREGVESRYQRIERLQFLEAVLRKLPPTHRSIICLCDLHGLSMQEVARRLGLTVAAAKTRHLRAMRFLLEISKAARERRMTVLELLSEQSRSAASASLQRSRRRKNRRRSTTPSFQSGDRCRGQA